MKLSRPSPGLVVAIIALVVASATTATAASVIIRNSAQIKTGAVNGNDIKNRSITGTDIADRSVTARDIDPEALASATEVARKKTENFPPGERRVATMSALPAGTYAVFAKTTIGPSGEDDPGLLGALLRQDKTNGAAICKLNAAGDEDAAVGTVVTPGTAGPVTLHLQLTRTLASPGDVTVTCSVAGIGWLASDTSIIAMKLARSARTDVTG